jgi:hypothetical protein
MVAFVFRSIPPITEFILVAAIHIEVPLQPIDLLLPQIFSRRRHVVHLLALLMFTLHQSHRCVGKIERASRLPFCVGHNHRPVLVM